MKTLSDVIAEGRGKTDSAEFALEVAKQLVAASEYDLEMMGAMARLCAFSGYDEDGIVEKYKTQIVARALLAAAGKP